MHLFVHHIRFAFNEIGVVNKLVRPHLIADGISSDDRAGRQSALCHQNLGSLRYGRGCLDLHADEESRVVYRHACEETSLGLSGKQGG